MTKQMVASKLYEMIEIEANQPKFATIVAHEVIIRTPPVSESRWLITVFLFFIIKIILF